VGLSQISVSVIIDTLKVIIIYQLLFLLLFLYADLVDSSEDAEGECDGSADNLQRDVYDIEDVEIDDHAVEDAHVAD